LSSVQQLLVLQGQEGDTETRHGGSENSFHFVGTINTISKDLAAPYPPVAHSFQRSPQSIQLSQEIDGYAALSSAFFLSFVEWIVV
jgi:hypothetical protein